MYYQESQKSQTNKNSRTDNIEDIKINNNENKIKLVKRTLENNTHVVIEDTKLKNITSWRKSKKKFF